MNLLTLQEAQEHDRRYTERLKLAADWIDKLGDDSELGAVFADLAGDLRNYGCFHPNVDSFVLNKLCERRSI